MLKFLLNLYSMQEIAEANLIIDGISNETSIWPLILLIVLTDYERTGRLKALFSCKQHAHELPLSTHFTMSKNWLKWSLVYRKICKTLTQARGLHSGCCVDSVSKEAVPRHRKTHHSCYHRACKWGTYNGWGKKATGLSVVAHHNLNLWGVVPPPSVHEI